MTVPERKQGAGDARHTGLTALYTADVLEALIDLVVCNLHSVLAIEMCILSVVFRARDVLHY